MTTIRLRRGTLAQWTVANPVLDVGEVGLELPDEPGGEIKQKVGDGVTAWRDLSYEDDASMLEIEGLPVVEGTSGGGADFLGYEWPKWGYGGSVAEKNENSPTLLDLEALDVAGMMWFPGVGFTTLENHITTPFATNMAGNIAGVAQRIFVDFDLVPNEYDPVTGQSTAYISTLPNARWFYLAEEGFLTLRFRNSANVSFIATATEQWAPKKRFRGYYDLNPNNSAVGGVWTVDFYVLDEDTGQYEDFGEQIVGSVPITAYKEILTDQSGNPLPQYLYVGSNYAGQVYRGGLIRLATRIGSHDADPIVELNTEEWALLGTPTFTSDGRTWTLQNPQADNFVTESCLASVGTALGEYVTLTGPADAPITPVQAATTRGLYSELEITDFRWSLKTRVARDEYARDNTLINLAAIPKIGRVPIHVDSDGVLIFDSPKVRRGNFELSTEEYAEAAAGSARSGAIAISNAYAQKISDELLASIANAEAFREDELDLEINDQRVVSNLIWNLDSPNHGLPPMGVGDGSSIDQQMVLDQASPIFAAAGGTGGFGAEPTYLTSLEDNATTPVAGSLRKIILDANAAWEADQSAKLYLIANPEDLDLDVDGAAHILLDSSSSDKEVRNIKLMCRNVTMDFTAIPGGLIIDGGGAPGPIPYCTTSGSNAAGTGTHTFLTASVADFSKAKLRVGGKIDVAHYVGDVWTHYGRDLTVTQINYDNPGAKPPSGSGSIVATGTLDTTAPSGSTIILGMNPPHNDPDTDEPMFFEPGTPGCEFYIGGEIYSDMFGPWTEGYVNVPAGNIIMRNMAFRSLWGGDIIDTGNLNDFSIGNYADTIWLDHMDWSNPDPFHDSMWQQSRGARGIGTSYCIFGPHYKAVNHFGGNVGSGGVDENGEIPSPNVHPFPPGFSAEDPGPYDYVPGVVGQHGNPTGAPIVILTTLHEHAWFIGNGQRSPKNIYFGEVHLLNSIVQDYGLPEADPILEVATRFPIDPLEGPVGPAPLITNGEAKTLYESVSIIPHVNALVPQGKKGIKYTRTGKAPAGFTESINVIHQDGAISEEDYDPEDKIPNFAARYSYVAESEEVYTRKIYNGAGAGTQSKMWSLVGVASVQSTITIKHDGTNIGAGDTEAKADTLDFIGGTVTYDDLTRVATVTFPAGGGGTPNLEDLDPTPIKTANYTAIAQDLVRFDTTAGALVMTLPTSPADGTNVGAQLTAGTNTLSVNAGGSDKFDVASTGPSVKTLRVPGRTRVWEYVAADAVWVERESTPLTSVVTSPPFTFAEPLTVRDGIYKYYVEDAWTIVKIRISVGTAPSGSALTVDVKKNNTSLFNANPGNRPSIAAGSTTAVSATPDITTMAAGDYLTCSITAIGSTTPGVGLTVQVYMQRL